jgi:VanZ family protein
MAPARRLAHWIGRLGPPIALMGVIFYLSHQPDLGTGLGTIDFVLRKLAHMTEYGLLFVLWLRALRGRAPWVAAAIAIAYAGTDELHQSFVTGRHGTPVDVLIDSTGVLIAALLLYRTGLGRWLRERDLLLERRRDRAPERDRDTVAAG